MHVSDRMAEMIKEELDVKDCKITCTVKEDACFVNIPEDEIKLENTGIQGNRDSFIFLYKEYRIEPHLFYFSCEGGYLTFCVLNYEIVIIASLLKIF